MSSARLVLAVSVLAVSAPFASACGDGAPSSSGELTVVEVVSNNEGVWVDEQGHTDDYIELLNQGKGPAKLSDYQLRIGKDLAKLPPPSPWKPVSACSCGPMANPKTELCTCPSGSKVEVKS